MDVSSMSRFEGVRTLRERRLPVALAVLLLALAGLLVPAGPASAADPTTSTFMVYCVEVGRSQIYAANRCPGSGVLVGAARYNLQWLNRSVKFLPGTYVESFYPKRGDTGYVEMFWAAKRGSSPDGPAGPVIGWDDAADGTRSVGSGGIIDGSCCVGGVSQISFVFRTLDSSFHVVESTAGDVTVKRP